MCVNLWYVFCLPFIYEKAFNGILCPVEFLKTGFVNMVVTSFLVKFPIS